MTEPESLQAIAAPAPAIVTKIYGAAAEFETPEALLAAVRRLRAEGWESLDAFTPFPIHGLDAALGAKRSGLGWIVLGGGVAGACAALLMQWWTGAVSYRLVVDGKPFFSVVPSIPITFELTVLLAAFGAVFGMFALNGLPRFNHPVFSHSSFERAMDDRFLLAIEAVGVGFDSGGALRALVAAGGCNAEVVTE